ncbi:type IV secretory system conjugative DNA transfer family protein [Glutamicibacter arilaitensis]|uniref:type IV secretory system conjugative DNA transfer family protein n=1 Tax=Glutamicibacter arilaitensis TaxID=256701 RepID=UPI003FCFF144
MSFHIFRMTRQAGESSDPAMFSQRAGSFSSKATSASSGGVLLVVRTESGVESYAGFDEPGKQSNAHLSLAQAVGAKAESDVLPREVSESKSVAFAQYRPSGFSRETQHGLDPFEVARVIANSLPIGAWVGISFRAPSKREKQRHTAWLRHRMGTQSPVHHAVSSNAVVASFWAGGDSFSDVDAVLTQLTAELPGFDLDVKPVRFTGRKSSVGKLVIGLALIGGWLTLPGLDVELFGAVDLGMLMGILGVLLVAYGALQVANVLPNVMKSFRSELSKGALPRPKKRVRKPRPPRKERYESKTVRDSEGNKSVQQKHITEFDGDYPLDKASFMVGGNVIAGLISPHTDGQSGNMASRERSTPTALTASNIGPYIGDSENDHVRLNAADMRYGIAVFGRPNGGKSVLIRSLWAWHIHERLSPCGKPGFPGKQNTLIAFESKGDGAEKYLSWSKSMGDQADLVDVMNPYTLGIDLFDVPGTVADRATFFVDAMRYAFGEQQIQFRSGETLTSVLTAALAITDEVIDIALEDPDVSRRAIVHNASPIHYAHILLAGASDREAVALWNGIQGLSVRLRERGQQSVDIDLAVDALQPLFKGRSESYRAKFFEAPRSKIAELNTLKYWWPVRRKKTSWSEIILNHRAIVINTGATSYYNKHNDESVSIVLTEMQTKLISSLLFFGMRNAVMRHCSGWYDENRNITFFSDELAMIAGENPEILMWFRDQGRSFGVRPVLATQRPDQVSEKLMNNLMTYLTKISFAQVDKKTAKYFADNITNDASSNANDIWTEQDLMHLKPYHVVLVTHVDEQLQSPLVLRLPNFEADMSNYSALQVSV